MENKQADVTAILKLYELRRDEELRKARRAGILPSLIRRARATSPAPVISGERESAYYPRGNFVLEYGLFVRLERRTGRKTFCRRQHRTRRRVRRIAAVFGGTPRQLFGDPNYNRHLEQLVMKTANSREKLEINRKLLARWAAKPASAEAV
jgi:hypothetical protein